MPRFRRTIVRVAAVAVLCASAACSGSSPRSCSQCGRDECRNLAFTIRLEDGKTVETCCPRCGLRYLAGPHPRVASLGVKAFDSARSLDARAALYVEGSDASPCARHEGRSPTDERGCCLKTVYDRCLPSLVAFDARERAETFAREHGGFVRTFAALEKGTP